MKKYRNLLIFALLLILPFRVNAEVQVVGGNTFTTKVNSIKEYVCDEIKEHELVIVGYISNKVVVYDETIGKEYLIDAMKPGVCEEHNTTSIDEEIYPEEYIWNNKKLYLYKYNSSSISMTMKTLDEELESNYTEKKEDGYYHVANPTLENLSNYYENYLFDLSTSTYDENETYYEFIENKYTIETEEIVFYEAVKIELDQNTYEPNKYYVLATPIEKQFITEFQTDKFTAPKEKTNLSTDVTLTKYNFVNHITFSNKNYYVFISNPFEEPSLYIFDENGVYQTFGQESLLVHDIHQTTDNKYLNVITFNNKIPNVMIFDEKLNLLVNHEFSQYKQIPDLVGNNENTMYFIVDGEKGQIEEINMYYLLNEDKQEYDNKDLTIKFSGSLDKFKSLKIFDKDQKEVPLDINDYILEKGSTIITLNKEFLSTLPDGNYNLKVEYNDGGYSSSTFIIKESSITNPPTSDGILTNMIIVMVSLLGLVTTILLSKRNKVRTK